MASRLKYIQNSLVRDALKEKSPYFDKFASGWWNEPDFGYLVAQKIVEARDLDLEFLQDDQLRKLILEDYAEARRAYQTRNYKSTILLCGSLVEALLVFAVEQAAIGGITNSQLYRMSLSELIEIAKANALIKDNNLFYYLDPLRHYRNMIHPAFQLRKLLTPDPPKARISLETVDLLIKDLGRN